MPAKETSVINDLALAHFLLKVTKIGSEVTKCGKSLISLGFSGDGIWQYVFIGF